MNIFQMIGPIMIGPSSSHTAGAVRLGRVANKIMDHAKPVEVQIELSGSFARTYQGHGTDRALLAGIMGYHSFSEEIRNALEIAGQRGIRYEFIPTDIPGAHPNTARISFRCADGSSGVVEGASSGGGNIRVDYVNGLRVDFTGEHTTILVLHRDRPGVIADVTNLMHAKYSDVNIGGFRLSRQERGGLARMSMELDELPPLGMTDDIEKLANVVKAILIRAI